jgi:hypothetical protein
MSRTITESIISFSAPTPFKKRIQQFAEDCGVSVSVIVRMAVAQALRNGINLTPENTPNNILSKSIELADKEYETNKKEMTTLATPTDVDNYFNSLK